MRLRRYPATHTAAGDALVRTFAAAVGNAELPMEPLPMRGGKRPGAGRPPRAGKASTVKVTVPLTDDEEDELTGALRDGETMAGMLRDGGLRLARRRLSRFVK